MPQLDATSFNSTFNMFANGTVDLALTGPFGPNFFTMRSGSVSPYFTYTAYSTAGDITFSAGAAAGTIDALVVSNDAGIPLFSFTDINIQLSALYNSASNAVAQEALWETLMAGATTVLAPQAVSALSVFGDFLRVNSGTSTGAADSFTGSTNIAAVQGTYVGDAWEVSSGATLNGGADSFTNVAGYLFGDAQNVYGSLNGGADLFSFSYTLSAMTPISQFAQIFGDAGSLYSSSAIFHGGIDTINLLNMASGNIYGDFGDGQGTVFAAGDSITVTRSSDAGSAFTSSFSRVFGDGYSFTAGHYEGGQDTITLTNILATDVVGDVYAASEAEMICAADTITALNTQTILPGQPVLPPPNIAALYGDIGTISNVTSPLLDFTGGNDNLTLNGVTASNIYGDAFFCNVDVFTGGNDTINYNYNYPVNTGGGMVIFGDADTDASNSFIGGNDTINLTTNATSTFYNIYGDARSLAGTGIEIFDGGDDIITFNGSPTTTTILIGDIYTVTGAIAAFTGGNDRLTGGGGNDHLFGDTQSSVTASSVTGGNDTLDGRGGNDYMDGGGGIHDRVIFSSLAQSVYVNLGGIGGANPYQAMGQGFDQIVNVEDVTGSSLNDTIIGNSVANELNGGAGNDRLDGAAGADRMIGALGNDTYYVDNILDITDDVTGGGGTGDYVFSTVSFTAAAGIERLYLTGVANINATGRAAQNDILVGNSGNNIINGLSGNDVMRGGLGNDTYYVDSVLDTTDETTGGGGASDFVYSSVSFTASLGIERLYLTGASAINGTGSNAQNDFLIGNAAANGLSGLTGNDYLMGGLGNDTLTGGGGLDRFYFDTALNAAANMDTVADFSIVDDTILLENAIFTALTVTGALAAGAFNTGTAATQADDRIIYNSATGALLYDADGLGGVAGVQFALLSTHPAGVSAADFAVY